MIGAAFTQWTEPWSRLGLWLTLWDDRSNLIEEPEEAPAFWRSLIQHSKRCQQRMQQIASHVLQGEPIVCELDGACGVIVVGTPLILRDRRVGVLLACGLSNDFFDDERLARFCSRHAIDRLVFERLASEVSAHPTSNLYTFGEIIQNNIETFSDGILSHRDILDLSSQLGEAYEELNLLYRASSSMTVSSSPEEPFRKLAEDLLEATVVESFATVLELPSSSVPHPIVVMAGPLDVAEEDVFRLYRQLQERERNAGVALVINEAGTDPEFAWASSWLDRVVYFELSSIEHRFGAIMAINHRDREDFGSEEVQLINAVAERSSAFLENFRLYEDLEELFMGMLTSLVSSIDAKDPYTCGHSQRVAWLSRHIAELAGQSPAQCHRVYLSGLLHDVGKIGVSEAVLCKAGKLTEEEYKLIQRHPEIGAHILENVKQVEDLIPGVMYHHERYDGRGYPHQLKGKDIPLLGRILGLADSFDAMTTNRTYRNARPMEIAMSEVRRCAGTQFDPDLAEVLLKANVEELKEELAAVSNAQASFSLVGHAGVVKGGTA